MNKIRYEIHERNGIYHVVQFEQRFWSESRHEYPTDHTSIESAKRAAEMFQRMDKNFEEAEAKRKIPWRKVWP